VLGAIAEVAMGRGDAAARPDALVAGLEPDKGERQLEGTHAPGREVELQLEIQEVGPLRRVGVTRFEAVRQAAELGLPEAVESQTPVPELEGGRRRRAREQAHQNELPEHLPRLPHARLRHGV
jgi:hypothetical protein